jgi:hypothetical protein
MLPGSGLLSMHWPIGKKPRGNTEGEQCIQDLVACMHDFDSFPFDPATRTLQSAMLAYDALIADFNSANAAGEEKLTSSCETRFSVRTPPSMYISL